MIHYQSCFFWSCHMHIPPAAFEQAQVQNAFRQKPFRQQSNAGSRVASMLGGNSGCGMSYRVPVSVAYSLATKVFIAKACCERRRSTHAAMPKGSRSFLFTIEHRRTTIAAIVAVAVSLRCILIQLSTSFPSLKPSDFLLPLRQQRGTVPFRILSLMQNYPYRGRRNSFLTLYHQRLR